MTKGLLYAGIRKAAQSLGMRRQLSALQNLGTSQEQEKQRAGSPGTSRDPAKIRGRADAPRNRELDLRHGRRHLWSYLVREGWDLRKEPKVERSMHKQLSFGAKRKPSLQLNSGQLLQEAEKGLQQGSGVYTAAWPTLYRF